MTAKISIDDLPEFDAAEYLNSTEARAAFLSDAMEEGDPAEIRRALNTVARSLGMSSIAGETGLGRASLYKALGDQGDPKFSTVLRVMAAMGLGLSARPLDGSDPELRTART
jgi:probable addiction module antidote protein